MDWRRERGWIILLGIIFLPVFAVIGLMAIGVVRVHTHVQASTANNSTPAVVVKRPDPTATATPWITVPSYQGVSAKGLIWPFVGSVSSYFGPTHPTGIDIDGFQREGEPIKAATSGTVIISSGNPCCELGLHVAICQYTPTVVLIEDYHTHYIGGDFYDGWYLRYQSCGLMTVYGHMSKLLVKEGDKVVQGQAIGIIGTTGYSTGTHLHFEVWTNDRRIVDPLEYLP